MKSDRKAVGIKVESPSGTEATLNAASDYLAAVGFKWAGAGKAKQDQFEYASAALGHVDPFTVSMQRACEFMLPIVGGGMPLGTNYSAPWLAVLRACGHAVTVNAGTSVVINPVSSGEESATLNVNEDGYLRKVVGARGNLKWLLEEDKVGRMTAALMGLYSSPTDATMPSVTLPTVNKPVGFNKSNTTVTLGALGLKCKSVEIDGGRSNAYRNLSGAEDVVPQDCKPTVTLRFELPTAAQKNVYSELESATQQALSIVHGTTAGNRWTFAGARAALLDLDDETDRGMIFAVAKFQLIPTVAGNDHYTITLT